MEEILQIIQDIHQNFTSDIENFNFDVLRKKCVFVPTPEEKNTPFDNTDRSYEYFKNMGLL